jgi:hypothetical protein
MANQLKVQQTIAVLMAAYPSKSNQDHMGPFLAMVEKLLSAYPPEVLDDLVNPRTGIVTQCSFFPSIAELKKFCEGSWDRLHPRVVVDRAEENAQLYGHVQTAADREAMRTASAERIRAMAAGFRAQVAAVPDPFRRKQDRVLSNSDHKAQAEQYLESVLANGGSASGVKLSLEASRKLTDGLS